MKQRSTATPTSAFVADHLRQAQIIRLSGDGAAEGRFDGSTPLTMDFTLSETGVVAGTYGDSTHVGQFTVDAGGRISTATDVLIDVSAALGSQAANKIFAGPSSGPNAAPTFRSLVVADLPSLGDARIYANISGGTGAPSSQSLTAVLDYVFGNTQGAILYRNATNWTLLAPGTSGYFLKTQGAGANPLWAAASGGGGGSYAPLTTGAEPVALVSDGAGALIMVAYTP